jgi:ribonuclease BN (tRNA processing enzyme)
MAEVGQLVLGHFSMRYTNRQVLLEEALVHFSSVVLAEEGQTYRWNRAK